ncbi:MAG: hypothetical protein PVF73_00360 [Bacteroidales bacterium]|jgi:spermidine synthase
MQTPYLLLPLAITSLLLYLLSHILVRTGILPKSFHRKFWNVVLLLTFLVTAVIGLLLVVQITYKLDWNIMDKLMAWHVDFGIVMSFAATYHLIWHFSYYLKLFNQKPGSKKEIPAGSLSDKGKRTELNLLVILSGFSATILQVLLIREVTTLFQGNEFMMGWTLGIWMLLTGAGAFAARKRREPAGFPQLKKIVLLICTIPLFFVVALNLLKNQIFPPGIMVGPAAFTFVMFILLAPVCLLTGSLFSLFIRYGKEDASGFIRIYVLESAGSLVGGVMVSFLLINWLSLLQSFALLLFFVSTVLTVLSGKKTSLAFATGAMAIFLILIFSSVENRIRGKLFHSKKVLENRETFYGNITVTENAGEYNFFSNGSLIFSSGNFVLREEYVHYALLQRDTPADVLLISGGISGMAGEILKYPSVVSVDYVELNPVLIGLGRKYDLLPGDPRVHVIRGDGKRYVATTNKRYDAVIMAVPGPSSLQANRYYTSEFLAGLKKCMKEDAVVLYGISSTGNYLSETQANKLAVLLNTLKKHFSYVELVPGEMDYLLASQKPLSLSVSLLYESKDIENMYVNSDYIDDASVRMRSEAVLSRLPGIRAVNTNDRPLPVFFDTLRFVSQFYSGRGTILYLPLLLLLLPLLFMKPETTGMYAAGFSGASVEILLIFVFQLIYGYVYAAIGLIVAIFMAGLALGSLAGYRIKIRKTTLPLLQLSLMVFLLLLPFILNLSGTGISPVLLWPVFFLLTFIPSAITGYIFVAASTLLGRETSVSAPVVYASDLLGSALGIVATTIILVPLAGIANTCYLLATANLLASGSYVLRKKFIS